MRQQTYPVQCECGKTHSVTAGAAGSKLACSCGKAVEVPTLGELKGSIGQSALSPEVEIEALLLSKKLPLESDCAICHRQTDDNFYCQVRCEAPTAAKPAMSWWQTVLITLLHPMNLLAAAVMMRRDVGEPIGRDVSFRLPVRMCAACMAEVESWDVVKQAIRRTPVYDRLLDKYPGSRLAKTT